MKNVFSSRPVVVIHAFQTTRAISSAATSANAYLGVADAHQVVGPDLHLRPALRRRRKRNAVHGLQIGDPEAAVRRRFDAHVVGRDERVVENDLGVVASTRARGPAVYRVARHHLIVPPQDFHES